MHIREGKQAPTREANKFHHGEPVNLDIWLAVGTFIKVFRESFREVSDSKEMISLMVFERILGSGRKCRFESLMLVDSKV